MIKINVNYNIDDILEFKKPHPCGGKNWRVVKSGVDCKLECTTCKRIIIIPRIDINKRLKRKINEEK